MELHDLLAQRDFEELTQEEQQQVLKVCSQEEYQAQRQAILASQALWVTEMAALQPPVPNKALQALKEKRLALEKEKVMVVPWWQQLANYSLPVWKVGVAALLLLCLKLAVPTGTSPQLPTVLVQQDTIYLERFHTKIEQVIQPADTIIKVIYKTIDTVATVLTPVLATTTGLYEGNYEKENILAQKGSLDIWQTSHNNTGYSLHQDTFLQELTRQVIANTALTSSNW